MKIYKIETINKKNTDPSLNTFLWIEYKSSSNNNYNKMTNKFLNNYSFAKEDTIDGAYIIPNSKVKISDVIQPPKVKDEFSNIIEEHKNREVLKQFGLIPNNKLIFNWPSWCWKTLSALAIANSLKKKLYIVNLSSIISSSLWKTSNNIFDIIEKCNNEDWIIFFDEFDALAKVRSDDKDHGELKRITSSLIQILDFINDNLIFIAATNHIDLIDKAIIRRFSKQINFEMPTKTYIKKTITKIFWDLNLNFSKEILKPLSEEYENKSYAEIKEELTSKIKKYIIRESKQWKITKEINFKILDY